MVRRSPWRVWLDFFATYSTKFAGWQWELHKFRQIYHLITISAVWEEKLDEIWKVFMTQLFAHRSLSAKTNFRSLRSRNTIPCSWHVLTTSHIWRNSRRASFSRRRFRTRTCEWRSPCRKEKRRREMNNEMLFKSTRESRLRLAKQSLSFHNDNMSRRHICGLGAVAQHNDYVKLTIYFAHLGHYSLLHHKLTCEGSKKRYVCDVFWMTFSR